MTIVLLFVALTIIILVFAIGDEFVWDMLFPLFLAVIGATLIGFIISSSIVTTAPNEYKTRNIEVVNDNIYYDKFQPIVYIYNGGELKKFKPSRVVYSASAKNL